MLNQLLKFTLISSVLLWLKPRWRGLLALTVLVIMVHVIHGEYLSYVELSGNQAFLVWSYVAKWLVLIAGVLVYLFFAITGPLTRSDTGKAKEPRIKSQPQKPAEPPVDDGFDFLRQKKQLQSRAEKILDSKKIDL